MLDMFSEILQVLQGSTPMKRTHLLLRNKMSTGSECKALLAEMVTLEDFASAKQWNLSKSQSNTKLTPMMIPPVEMNDGVDIQVA